MSVVTGDLWRFLPKGASAEAPGKDREEAIRNAFAFMDAHRGRRRKTAEESFEVTRVRRLGPGWWSVRYRRKSARKEEVSP